MKQRILGIGALLAGGAVVVSAADLIPYHRKAKLRCGLPCGYDYESRRKTLPSMGTSFDVLALTEVAPQVLVQTTTDVVPPRSILGKEEPVRYWQVIDRELRVNHCAISQVALWIDSYGRWSTNLRATQFPFVGPGLQATPEARFIRNKFYVTVRGYGATPVRETPELAIVGKPELFQIQMQPFWVDRSQVELHRETGCLRPEELQHLKLVNRVEVEFRYE